MATKWTPAQRVAIDTRDRTILLSAAAGSGKTAVLTERIISSLLDKTAPLDLSRILAVTFTRSAAGEMRVRIGKKLTEAIENDPENQHLANQLRLLPSASISTIDSFCIGILRRFAPLKQISPAFRVADEQEAKLLRISFMEELIRDGYAGRLPSVSSEEFTSFVKQVVTIKSESDLGEILLTLLTRLDSFEDGVGTLFTFADQLCRDGARPLEETSWWQLAMGELTALCAYYKGILEKDLTYIEDETLYKNVETYYNLFKTLPTSLTGSKIVYTLPSLTATKDYQKTDLDESICNHARAGKTALDELVKELFSFDEDAWTRTFTKLGKEVTTLAYICDAFQKRYEAECRRRSALDFSTITRFTYQLLLEDPTIAESLRGEYDAVYVDEYQDVNPIQHAIFEAISPKTGRFLVGDIKQSIYRFRQADPTVFAGLRQVFPNLDTEQFSPAVKHFMSQNFRSDRGVVDAINEIFDFLFGYAGDSIGYVPADRLDCGKNQDSVVYSPLPTIAFFDSPAGVKKTQEDALAMARAAYEGEEIPDTTPEDMAEAEGKPHREAMWIAKRIHDLLGETRSDGVTPIRPEDIAILIHSANKSYKPYETALALYGISCQKPRDSEYFSSPEVLLALALLNTIENPLRDIYLTATLCSPLYRFTPDDLALIRLDTPKEIPLYEALKQWCNDHADFTKGHFFLRQLDAFRRVSESIPVDQLLRRLFDETPLLAIAGAENPNGEKNLKLLYNYARTYQGVAFSGLYGFIRFLDKQIESGATFTVQGTGEGKSGVTICTIHASKGLQYPVVFLANCGASLPQNDSQATIICDKDVGISFFLRDEEERARMPHPVHHILKRVLNRQSFEEEMRLLYVALTRAEERLFITGMVKRGYLNNLLPKVQEVADYPSNFSVHTLNSYMKMTLAAYFASSNKGAFEFLLDPEFTLAEGGATLPQEAPDPEKVEALKTLLASRFAFSYPHQHLAGLPKKFSISRLKPDFLDTPEEETTSFDDTPLVKGIVELKTEEEPQVDTGAKKWNRLPVAYAGVMPPDPTDRGIASHLFMQFCDFENLVKNGVENETKRLLNLGFLDDRMVSLMRPRELEKFRASSLLSTIRGAKEMWREFRFNIKLPATLFSQDEERKKELAGETIFAQGVIDMLLEMPNGDLILIDYKTDRFTPEEKKNPALAAKKMRERHSIQLSFYGEAVKEIFGKRPTKTLVYALELGYTIEV